ncbi:MAG: adenosylmethionine decarboxylase [Cardiobacteriaceae bacterium]|nr:adenosylmethionine decarboxylase [Cardiobacteriaceae bacterium]
MTHSPGSHGLLDLYHCDAALLGDAAYLEAQLRHAAAQAGATILAAHFHHFGENAGVTGVLLLAESHISLHTWPEHRFAAFDIFLCGELKLEAARESLCRAFPGSRAQWRVEKRGTDLPGQT